MLGVIKVTMQNLNRRIASAMAPPGTDPESAAVTSIIERMRAGEPAVAIARETRAVREAEPGEHEGGTPGD